MFYKKKYLSVFIVLFFSNIFSPLAFSCNINHMINEINSIEVTFKQSLVSMNTIRDCYVANNNFMAIFPSAYILTTKATEDKLNDNFFENPDWVKKVITEFYRLYQNALVNYELENYSLVPRTWLWAFKESHKIKPSAFKTLLLSMHAHIDRDLAVALSKSGVSLKKCLTCFRDYFKTDFILTNTLNKLWNSLEEFDPYLNQTSRKNSSYNYKIAAILKKSRKRAWKLALKMQRDHHKYNIRKIDSLANISNRILLLSPKHFTKMVSFILSILSPKKYYK